MFQELFMPWINMCARVALSLADVAIATAVTGVTRVQSDSLDQIRNCVEAGSSWDRRDLGEVGIDVVGAHRGRPNNAH